MRNELIRYGVSQVSAASKTNPGSYAHDEEGTGTQFSTGDHRSLDEVISSLADAGYIPSFCTGCYRKGRVGHDFMDLAKPGLIKDFCLPNAMFTFQEYLEDFASVETKRKGLELIEKMTNEITKPQLQKKIEENLESIHKGQRDIYF